MIPVRAPEFPDEVERVYRRARRLEWITLGYVGLGAVFKYFAMGSSQAMRTSFFDDLLSLAPAAAFLVGTAVARGRPTEDFPYGKHRATSIAHLVAALALLTVGLFLAGESAVKLAKGERATIGGVALFGEVIWGGWPMLAALAYTSIPSVFLGRTKLRLAPQMHDKVLHADAQMMKADWLTGIAAAVGVIGAGFGVWWLDPVAALLVSVDIVHDGASNLGTAVTDLVQRRPRTTANDEWESLPERLRDLFKGLDWVEDADVRLREEGHVFFGEVLVVPRPGTEDLLGRVATATEQGRALDWRVHELLVAPVPELRRP